MSKIMKMKPIITRIYYLYRNEKVSNGEEIKIREFEYDKRDKTKGEIYYKIDQSSANKILGLQDNSFYITSETTDGAKSLIYTGNFLATADFADNNSNAQIQLANDKLINKNYEVQALSNQNTAQITEIKKLRKDLDSMISKNKKLLVSLDKEDDELESLSNSLKQRGEDLSDVQEKRAEIQNLIENNTIAFDRNPNLTTISVNNGTEENLQSTTKKPTYTKKPNSNVPQERTPTLSSKEEQASKLNTSIKNSKISPYSSKRVIKKQTN